MKEGVQLSAYGSPRLKIQLKVDEQSAVGSAGSAEGALNTVKICGFRTCSDINEEVIKLRLSMEKYHGGPLDDSRFEVVEQKSRAPFVLATFLSSSRTHSVILVIYLILVYKCSGFMIEQ